MQGASRRRMVFVSVAVLGLVAVLALTVAPPSPRTLVAVDRFGDGVTLHAPGPAISFLPLEQRLRVPREGDAARVDAPIRAALPGGAELDAVVHLTLTGSGPLPLAAADVRRLGWEGAWSAWLDSRLDISHDEAADLVAASETWRAIFPGATAPAPLDLASRLAPLFAGVTLRSVDVTPTPDTELVRGLARQRLRSMVRPAGRLVLIGLDGLDWQLVDELTANGTMPNLGRILRTGAQAVEEVHASLLSPLVWTSIATGVRPEVHGVLDFVEQDPETGAPRPVSAFSRKVPALWEMTAAAGRSSAVIGWWATFPASAPPGGAVYSDRLSEQLMGMEARLPGLADPPEADAAARDLVVRGSEVTPEMLAPVLRVTRDELDAVPAGEAAWDSPVGGLARLMAATITVQRITDHELDAGTDVVLSYIEGTDTVGHLFGPHRPPALPFVSAADARRFGPVVDRYHAFIDAWLGTVVARLQPDDTLVLVSDHGFQWGEGRPELASGAHTPTAVHWHRPEGFFFARGPRVRPTTRRQRLDMLDVAPSLLALAGLPPGVSMPGSVPDWLLPADADPAAGRVGYTELVPVQQPASVELPPEARAEELAKLRALGYLAGDDAGGGSAEQDAQALPEREREAVDARLESRRLHNLAVSLLQAGDTAGAEKNLREAIAANPAYAPSHYVLSGVLRSQSRFDDADREFWRAVELGLGDPQAAIVRVAREYRGLGQPQRAIATLETGLQDHPDNGEMLVSLGILLGEAKDLPGARGVLERAVAAMPDDAFAWYNLAVAQIGTGDPVAARRSLTRAVALDPDDGRARALLQRLGGPLR